MKLPDKVVYKDLFLNPEECFTTIPTKSFIRFIQAQGYTHHSFYRGLVKLMAIKHAAVACVYEAILTMTLEMTTWEIIWTVVTHAGRQTEQRQPFDPAPLKTMVDTCPKPFLIVSLSVVIPCLEAGHSNTLLFNLKARTVNHFDPHGDRMQAFPNETENMLINTKIREEIERLVGSLGFQYLPPTAVCSSTEPALERCPNEFGIDQRQARGPQALLQQEVVQNPQCSLRTQLNYHHFLGTCTTWAIWAMHLRLVFHDDDRDLETIVTRVLLAIRSKLKDFIEEFLWQAYQSLGITEHDSQLTLQDYVDDDVERTLRIQQEQEPDGSISYRFLGLFDKFSNENKDVLDGLNTDGPFTEALNRDNRINYPIILKNYERYAKLPGYKIWGARFIQLQKQQRYTDAWHYAGYLRLGDLPITLHRAEGSSTHFMLQPDKFVGYFLRYMETDHQFMQSMLEASTLLSPDQLSTIIPGYDTIASLPNYQQWKHQLRSKSLSVINIPCSYFRLADGRFIYSERVAPEFYPAHMNALTLASYLRIMEWGRFRKGN